MSSYPNVAERNQSSTSIIEPFVVLEQNCSYWELVWMIQQILGCTPSEITRLVARFFIVHHILPSEVKAIRASSSSSLAAYPLSAVLDPTIESWWVSAPGTMRRGKGKQHIEFQLSLSPPSSPSSFYSSPPRGRVCRLSKFSIQIPPLPMGPLSVGKFRLERCVEDKTEKVDTRTASGHTISASAGGTTSNESFSSSSSSLVTSSSCSWEPCSPIWMVENKSGWQEYILDPPVDLRSVRVVCLTNQMHEILNQDSGTIRGTTTTTRTPTINGSSSAEEEEDGDDCPDPYGIIYSRVGYYCVKFE